MKNLCDYMIIQRDKNGFGTGVFCGEKELPENAVVVARAVREDDNMTVIPWSECEKDSAGWRIEMKLPQGGLYRIEARLTDVPFEPHNNRYDWFPMIACASHVGVGEVFVLAGQSNMSGYGKDPAYDPPELGVHLFDNAGRWVIASHPLNTVPDPVYKNNDGNSGSSPGLAFGRIMHRRLGVPIGLVMTAAGGTSLEWWNPAEEDPYLYYNMKEKLKETGDFAAMLWYQGCNETNEEEAYSYYEKFRQAAGLWREEYGDFPIVVCQLNRHAWKGEDRDRLWGIVREAQRRAGMTVPGVYTVPTHDMFTVDGIHNAGGACVVIGERMANTLLKEFYGLPGCSAPNIESIRKLDSCSVLLNIRGALTLRAMDDLACGMNIEDENGMMKCTSVRICPEGAVVTGERDICGKAVLHAYWEREEAAFCVRDNYGMPLLACYGVEIEEQ